ncbi:MAG: thiamine pyrophosphate-binding protein, partial [Eubacterium sp.]|nr:thiamine pyrophosphate-binding protein [Eubacterium sp.]
MKRIAEEGVDQLFYVSGGQCVYLCDALRRSEQINPVAMHHEQAAAMAALSYSEYTNNFGACLVTTGCAGTNTLTGVLHAWQDSIPMIVISGQQNYENTIKGVGYPYRQIGIQEADTERIVTPITKYAVTVPDASE